LAGPRNCLGQHVGMIEVKLMLLYFLRNFDFKIKEDYELKMKILFVYEPADLEFIYINKK